MFASALQKKKEDGSALQCDEDEAAKMADLLAQAIERLEAQEAMNNTATQHIIQEQLRVQRESQLEASTRYDACEDACM
jgi:K+/H+ antiporter YhaU regulatory subunit KhtT